MRRFTKDSKADQPTFQKVGGSGLKNSSPTFSNSGGMLEWLTHLLVGGSVGKTFRSTIDKLSKFIYFSSEL